MDRPAGGKVKGGISAESDRVTVRDNESLPSARPVLVEEGEDPLFGRAVDLASGFVGKEDGRLGRERHREAGSRRLAPGQLLRIGMSPLADTDEIQHPPPPPPVPLPP